MQKTIRFYLTICFGRDRMGRLVKHRFKVSPSEKNYYFELDYWTALQACRFLDAGARLDKREPLFVLLFKEGGRLQTPLLTASQGAKFFGGTELGFERRVTYLPYVQRKVGGERLYLSFLVDILLINAGMLPSLRMEWWKNARLSTCLTKIQSDGTERSARWA
jgi:hypothetical protein